MRKLTFTGTRFVVTSSIIILTLASALGTVFYLKSIRPTWFSNSFVVGDTKKLQESVHSVSNNLHTSPSFEDKSNFEGGLTEVETENDDDRIVDAAGEIENLRKMKRVYGDEPDANLKIIPAGPPSADHQKFTLLTSIPKTVLSEISIELIVEKPYRFKPSFWSSEYNYNVKILRINNIFRKKDLKAIAIMFWENKESIESTRLSQTELSKKFVSVESVQGLIKGFKSDSEKANDVFEEDLDHEYKLMQSSSAETAKALSGYFQSRIRNQHHDTLTSVLKQAMDRQEKTHIAILFNNKIHEIFSDVNLENFN